MTKKLYDLKNTRAGLIKDAETALNGKNMELYNSKMAEIRNLNTEIEGVENLIAEQGKFSDSDAKLVNLADALGQQKEARATQNRLDSIRSGNEYANAFANALQNKVNVDAGTGIENLAPLYNALSVGGGSPAGSEGGFLVPVEFDNMIHRKKKEFVCLVDYFNVENVEGMTGWRAVETSAGRKALTELDELATITEKDKPTFTKVNYKIKKYGDRIAISSELLNDNTAGLLQYLADWFTPKVVLTENTILLALLNSLTGTTLKVGSEVAGIKTVLNKEINTAHSKNATILTNQSGYNFIDCLEDSQGRGLLTPNLADPDTYRLKNKPVVSADDDLIENTTTTVESVETTTAPIYIGDLKSFGTLFRRQALEFATTNIGGNSWATGSSEVRGICRMDAQKVDAKAVVKKTVTVEA